MPVRHVLLGLLTAFVVVAGVYLFIEVRSTAASATPVTPKPVVAQVEHHDDTSPPPTARVPDHKALAATPEIASNEPAKEEESTDDTIAAIDKPNPKLDAIMDQANKHYDKNEYEDAKAIAAKVLAKQPTNIRMMRIMVSSSCIDGDVAVAQKWFEQLPKNDREQLKVRCAKYMVTFKDPPQ